MNLYGLRARIVEELVGIDAEMLRAAFVVAALSPDQSTHCGAIVRAKNGRFVSGYNDVVCPSEGWESDRSLKLEAMIHAEESAILVAASVGIPTIAATLYGTWVACPGCARRIVRSGVRRVVSSLKAIERTPERWEDDVRMGLDILYREGVEVDLIAPEVGSDEILFDGCAVTF